MNKLPLVARLILGLIFTVFGLNGFFNFLPMPPLPEAATNFMGALMDTGYMMTLVKLTEVVAGVLLLTGRFVPLALTILAPVVVNIVLFHAFLAPGGMLLPLVVLALQLYLAYAYRGSFTGVLHQGAQPS